MITELSIIIPALNEEKYLPLLLDSFAKQNYTGKWEIIVVDGKSTDRTKKVAESHKKKLSNLTVISTERGVSRQRNAGAKEAKYKYLVFIDADTVLPPDFLMRVARKINPKEKIFVGLPLILPFQGTIVDYALVYIAYNFFILAWKFKPLVAGGCLITTKETHKTIGGFNEKILYGEDMDYGLRATKKRAFYHLYASIHLFTSARRARGMGRRNLGKVWLKNYMKLVLKGQIENQSAQDYPYGHYST